MLRNVDLEQLESWSTENIENVQRFVDSSVKFLDTSSELLSALTTVSEKEHDALTALEGFKVLSQDTVLPLLSAFRDKDDETMKAVWNTLKTREKPEGI